MGEIAVGYWQSVIGVMDCTGIVYKVSVLRVIICRKVW
jgi:hypothetical protein